MTDRNTNPPESHEDCDACAVPPSRRRFLRDAFVAAAGTLVALGASRETAFALPVELTRALTRGAGGSLRYPIPATDSVQIDRDNQLILARWANVVYAFNLSCPHQNTALRWDDADHRFNCPKHHSQYAPDGKYISGRATRSMDRLAISRDAAAPNMVDVDVNTMYREDKDPGPYAAALVRLA